MARRSATRRCPTCRRTPGSDPRCLQCSVSPARPAGTRAFAASLRRQPPAMTTPAPEAARRRFWAPVTGQVRREQEAVLGRAKGTGLVVAGAFALPVSISIVTGAMTASSAIGGVVTLMTIMLLPVAFVVLLMSIGRGGAFGHANRVAINSVRLGSSLSGRRRRLATSGRILIVGTGPRECRVAVARDIDIPIGSTVTVRGPRLGGYRHAWLIQVHGLDDHALPTRGVVFTITALVGGLVLTAAAVTSGVGGLL